MAVGGFFLGPGARRTTGIPLQDVPTISPSLPLKPDNKIFFGLAIFLILSFFEIFFKKRGRHHAAPHRQIERTQRL
jgi:hypothetical protein